jgi:hypothetical protein
MITDQNNIINIDKTLEDAKRLLNQFQKIKLRNESNYESKFFQYLDKLSIIQLILPYLETKDLFNFRLSSRLINSTVCSMPNMILSQYRLKLKIKKENNPPKIDLNALNAQINNEEDIKVQVKSLREINEFLKTKLFQSENIIRVCKNDIEYMKNEAKNQEDIISKLNQTLSQTSKEEEEIKKENKILKHQLEDLNKKYDESVEQNSKIIDDLKKETEQLKGEKNKFAAAVIQLKKITDDLKKKNVSKSEALKAIKNFFMNSTMLKLKDIEGFKDKKEENGITEQK